MDRGKKKQSKPRLIYSVCKGVATAAKSLQSCPTLCDPIDAAHQAPLSWDSPGRNTGVGCHFLLQCVKVKVKSSSCVQLFATPWTEAHQAPPSMGFSRQEYWSGMPVPSVVCKAVACYFMIWVCISVVNNSKKF